MGTLNRSLSKEVMDELERAAAREGVPAKDLAERLLVSAVREVVIARGLEAWGRIKAGESPFDEEAADMIAREALAEVRAEGDGSGR